VAAAIFIAAVVISASGLAYYSLEAATLKTTTLIVTTTSDVTTTSIITETSPVTTTSTITTTSTLVTELTSTFNNSYSYLTAAFTCEEPGGYMPCWGGTPYVFDCAAEAMTSGGCTQNVTSILKPPTSYTINIRYPFVNATVPSEFNCLWAAAGLRQSQEFAYCVPLNSTAFIIGEPEPPIVSGPTYNNG
jgi:hypothetical protein